MKKNEISGLLERQRKGFSLAQPFYLDAEIFETEMNTIFFKSWMYVGHISELANVGDYFLYEMGGESVIIVRNKPDEICALVNVCRHRGSRVCLTKQGNEKLFSCKYHGWTYQLDGALRGASHAGPDFNKSDYGLRRINVEVFDGLIFVNFSDKPADFSLIRQDLSGAMQPFRFDRTKVARKQSYIIDSNWKLMLENYCECYHCAPSHVAYAQRHVRARSRAERSAMADEVMDRAESCGLTRDSFYASWKLSGGVGVDRGVERTALTKGYQTGSQDGKPIAPLLGSITAYDGGVSDFHIGSFNFIAAYCDYAVVFRFTPLGVDKSECEISWLVNESAKEGVDYDLERLIWLWDVTTIEDKRIIEHNQEGVKSRFYTPGPYTEMEPFPSAFVEWYVDVLKKSYQAS